MALCNFPRSTLIFILTIYFLFIIFVFLSGSTPSRDISTDDEVFRRMKSYKVVFAAITRDDMDTLPGIIHKLARLGHQLFDEIAFVIAENDSSDHSKEFLDNVKLRQPDFNVVRISRDFGLKKRPAISFMAKMRNLYLRHIYSDSRLANFDYLIAFDCDFQPDKFVSFSGLVDSFNQSIPWDVMTANGELYGKMHDVFAYRTEQVNIPFSPSKYPAGIDSYWPSIWPLKHHVPDGPPLPVLSAFGGLGIYRMSSLRGLLHDEASEDCEHVSLHEQIRARGGKIFLNPKMRLTYSCCPPPFWMKYFRL